MKKKNEVTVCVLKRDVLLSASNASRNLRFPAISSYSGFV